MAATSAFDDKPLLGAIAQVKAIAEARISFNRGLKEFLEDENIPHTSKLKIFPAPSLCRKNTKMRKEHMNRLEKDFHEAKKIFSELIKGTNSDMEDYHRLLSVLSVEDITNNTEGFKSILEKVWRLSQNSSASGYSLAGDFFEKDAFGHIFEMLEPFLNLKQKLFFKYAEYKQHQGSLYRVSVKSHLLNRDIERLHTRYRKIRPHLDVENKINQQYAADILEVLRTLEQGVTPDDLSIIDLLWKFQNAVENLEKSVRMSIIASQSTSRSFVPPAELPISESVRTNGMPPVEEESGICPPQDGGAKQQLLLPHELSVEEASFTATSTAVPVCASLPQPTLVQKPKARSYDPLHVDLTSRFDWRVIPTWIEELVQGKIPVKYRQLRPYLEKLGVIKNNSGSKRMFTFHQTPNGKLTAIFFHEPHPDDGRGMEDPCYVKPIVDGFARAGYTW